MPKFDALVLAAGQSSRLGVPKMLLPAGDGETVVSRVVGSALAGVAGQVAVVLGRDAELVRHAIESSLTRWGRDLGERRLSERLLIVENAGYESGLAGSVVVGLRRLLEAGTGSAETAILLGDQPLVSATLVRRLVAVMRSSQSDVVAVAAVCEGQRRNPVVFSSRVLPELLSLKGDAGARALLRERAAQVEGVEFGSGLWARDLDTWTDYEALATAAGWDRELAAAPEAMDAETLPAALWNELEAIGKRRPVPWLAPGVLFVTLGREVQLPSASRLARNNLVAVHCSTSTRARSLMRLNTVLLGDGLSPQAYLASLRAAALATLGHSTTGDGRQVESILSGKGMA